MVRALSFKGDKKASKKRKRTHDNAEPEDGDTPTSKQLTTTTTTEPPPPEDDDNWVAADALADISGPIMFVLPATEPLMSLSVDQLGKVFAQKVENMVEGQEQQTAEPHDVRQVWIATRVVGSEGDFTFKGHHGRYLGCDRYGVCSATREAISPEETFKLIVRDEGEEGKGLFDVQTIMRKRFLAVDGDRTPVEIRGDAEEVGETTRVRVRMQARFKPKHKVDKAEKVRAKISRKELEDEIGRRLEDDEVKRLKRARREGDYHEVMLQYKVKSKHDKFA